MPSQLRSLLGTIRRKPTQANDGRSSEASSGLKNNEKTTIGHDLKNLGVKNAKFALEAITTLASGEPLDDKDLLLENGVQMLQGLPPNSGLSAKVSGMLWVFGVLLSKVNANRWFHYYALERSSTSFSYTSWPNHPIPQTRWRRKQSTQPRDGQGGNSVCQKCATNKTQG
jgi:hypothetical protein